MSTPQTQLAARNKLTLYKVVFECVFVRYVISFLFVFLLINPVAPAFAAGEEVTPNPEAQVEEIEEVAEETEQNFTEEAEEESNVEIDTIEEIGEVGVEDSEDLSVSEISESEEIEAGTSEAVFDEILTTSSEDVEVSETVSSTSVNINLNNDSGSIENKDIAASTTNDSGDFDSETLSVATTSSSSTTTAEQSGTASSSQQATSTSTTSPEITSESENFPDNQTEPEPESDSDVLPTSDIATSTVDSATTSATSATSTPKIATTTQNISYVINELNAHQFSKDECVSVGDGAFYCSELEGAPEYVANGVYVAPDTDGDKEIFIHLDGDDIQISSNTVDDASPYYDALSKRVVWHSMKNDRFQILTFNIETGETESLTDTTYHNMEPVAYGDITLWQAWVEDSWEIMKYENGSTTRLTNNHVHDVTPHMRGGHILWQTQFADGWRVAVYDTSSESIEYITAGDGSLIENPRMVLVYDSTSENGDVRTLGYDFDSKSSFVINNLPTDLPEKLPEPDQTGETRALIQTKPTPKESEVIKTEPIEPNVGSSATSTNSNSTSTSSVATSTSTTGEEEATLIIPDNSPATSTPNINSTSDILVPSSSTSTASTTPQHIEDVVIPPVSSTSTQNVG